MRFEVVLQWPAHSLNRYDEMVSVEELLIAKLTKQSKVDGQDFGTGETNIFVHTDDPRRAFTEIKSILSGHRLWPDAVIAYRQWMELNTAYSGRRALRPSMSGKATYRDLTAEIVSDECYGDFRTVIAL
jgi:hypothetical protein